MDKKTKEAIEELKNKISEMGGEIFTMKAQQHGKTVILNRVVDQLHECKESVIEFIYYENPTKHKPPTGLMPKKIFLENRKEDIVNAISRFIGSTKNIPKEWEEELKQINRYLITYHPHEYNLQSEIKTCHACGKPIEEKTYELQIGKKVQLLKESEIRSVQHYVCKSTGESLSKRERNITDAIISHFILNN